MQCNVGEQKQGDNMTTKVTTNNTLTYGIIGGVGGIIILAGFVALIIFRRKQATAEDTDAMQMQGKNVSDWLP